MKNVTQNVFGDKDESMHCFDDSTADVGSDCESVFKQKGLHFIHINAKSLLPKMEEVGHLVLTSKAGMIAVSETWLDCSIQDAEIELTGYSIDRSINKGGVCPFLRTDMSYNPCADLQEGLEAAWVELPLPKSKPIIKGVCYRPSKQTEFYELLETVCRKSNVCVENECTIMGDLNTKLLLPQSGLKNSFLNLCRVSGLHQLITEATRLSMNSQSLLDLILSSESYPNQVSWM